VIRIIIGSAVETLPSSQKGTGHFMKRIHSRNSSNPNSNDPNNGSKIL